MGITVEFMDFKEMVDFAHQLIGKSTATTGAQPVQETPVQQVPQTAPAQQTAPVQQQMQQQTAPVQQQMQQQISPVQQTAPVQQTVPTTNTNYTMDDLAKAAMTLMDAGRQGELLNLLAQFGVDALPSLPQEQYGAFATALRGLGAQI